MASPRQNYKSPFNKYPYNIPVSFYFNVEVLGFEKVLTECMFQEVSGINVSLDTITVEEGGVLDYSHKLPVRAKYDNLILKRGFLHGSSLLEWIDNALIAFNFVPKTVEVSLLNESGNKLSTWTFQNAYPVSIKVSNFKSQDNSIVVETLELAYNYFDRVDVTQTLVPATVV